MPQPFRKAGAVHDTLKALVVAGAFRPGEHLPAEALAVHLGVSVTPVREALNRLHGEGWIVTRPQSGFFVPTPSVIDLSDRYAVAQVILDHALAVGSDWPTGGVLDREFTARAEAATVRIEPERLALEVETALVRAAQTSGNAVMAALVLEFTLRSHRVRRIDLETQEGRARALEAYRRLIGAFDRRHRDEARTSVRDLLDAQSSHMTALVKEALARSHLAPAIDLRAPSSPIGR